MVVILTDFCFSFVFLLFFVLLNVVLIAAISYIFSRYQNKILKKNIDKMREILNSKTKEIQEYKTALAKLINYDPLTGLRNRSSIFELLELELRRLERVENITLSIIVFDIDHFKEINHRFGPKVGDELLKFFGKFLVDNLRRLDIVGRLGEDEFIAILPNTDVNGARIAAEKIRKKIESSILRYENEPITFTISGGIASLNSKIRFSTSSMEEFIKVAERKLKEAKNEGGNCIKWK